MDSQFHTTTMCKQWSMDEIMVEASSYHDALWQVGLSHDNRSQFDHRVHYCCVARVGGEGSAYIAKRCIIALHIKLVLDRYRYAM